MRQWQHLVSFALPQVRLTQERRNAHDAAITESFPHSKDTNDTADGETACAQNARLLLNDNVLWQHRLVADDTADNTADGETACVQNARLLLNDSVL